ncbi:hypothetical protein EYF80_040872 [Liparis tanakae]|uniref:Uncharacterized protein n=1 Tax=Liparis tanakae TaxID=230148 RepID=A0A4Z2G5Y8_9TELE|nr:hypothetical protein EYF80_040872 [Liparis tanakae]
MLRELHPHPGTYNTRIDIPAQFGGPDGREVLSGPLRVAPREEPLTCDNAASSRSLVGIRQLASPRKHIRMWSTSAQRPTVSIRTVKPPRRTTTVFSTTWLPG